MNLIKESYFKTPLYYINDISWLENLNINCDKYIIDAIKNNKDNFQLVYHSNSLAEDNNFKKFIKFICNNSYKILDEQGYDMNLYSLIVSDLWVQEFSKKGGGNHNSHVHSNCHISGFYFLKCSNKTSFPVFHDSRLNKKMIQLKEKNEKLHTDSSEKIHVTPNPGLFVFFNSYLEHEFVVDHGIEPFRFIHFNLQAIPKELANNQVKRI